MKKLIKTTKEHEAALTRLKELMLKNPVQDSDEANELELLALLIKSYEDKNVIIDPPTPLEAIQFRMEQAGLKQKDLIPFIGTKSRVSEVLAGKRPLTLAMARELHKGLGIPAEILLEGARAIVPEKIDTKLYPVREMHKRGWFEGFSKHAWADVKAHGEEMLHQFFGSFRDQKAIALNRTGFKPNASLDDFALEAWRCRIVNEAKKQDLPEYNHKDISDEFVSSLVKMSQFAQGPEMAVQLLKERGIAVVFASHLPRTYLDGAAVLGYKNRPVIGMTLRHDREDNFWFTLLHELGHVRLHLGKFGEEFFDDTESGDNTAIEQEANDFAMEHLIPSSDWASISKLTHAAEVRKAAKRLAIHPSIIAGRLRQEAHDWSIHRTLVGQGEVRGKLGFADSWPV
jgi:HTH-type transcriptional regulator / antitoxin HigA